MKARALGHKYDQNGPWQPLDWHHGLFGHETPSSLTKLARIWLSFRGITLRINWIEQNDFTFFNTTLLCLNCVGHMNSHLSTLFLKIII